MPELWEKSVIDSWCQDWLDRFPSNLQDAKMATTFEKEAMNDRKMLLSEFDPQWKEGVNGELILKMWCPCGRKSRHRIRVPITTVKVETPWRRNGPSFGALTIAPSIDTGCWHGFIEDGQVRHA